MRGIGDVEHIHPATLAVGLPERGQIGVVAKRCHVGDAARCRAADPQLAHQLDVLAGRWQVALARPVLPVVCRVILDRRVEHPVADDMVALGLDPLRGGIRRRHTGAEHREDQGDRKPSPQSPGHDASLG
jgi:hypothetical protein